MKSSPMKNMKDHAGTIAAVGATVAAVAAGSYYFFGPKGKQHRHAMKGWMLKMKAEVIEKMEQAEELTQPVYEKIVDAVAKTQAAADVVNKTQVLALADDLKKQWKTFAKLIPGATKGARSKRTSTKRSSKAKK